MWSLHVPPLPAYFSGYSRLGSYSHRLSNSQQALTNQSETSCQGITDKSLCLWPSGSYLAIGVNVSPHFQPAVFQHYLEAPTCLLYPKNGAEKTL